MLDFFLHTQQNFRRRYASFVRPDRILLTGHSHQAWPDSVRDALAACFDDAATHVDQKWSQCIFPKMNRVGERILTRLGFAPTDSIAFGKSTHELVFRLITSLPVPFHELRIVSTTSEFHSLHRQLRRLEEAGSKITWVDGREREGLVERLLSSITSNTHLVAISSVFYEDAYILPQLQAVIDKAIALGTIVLIDAYHSFNVAPIEWGPHKERLFVTAGGYKYAQFGEGICFLRIPSNCALRPLYTGWFAEFDSLQHANRSVTYAPNGARFAGASFDPSAFYRAEAVLRHFDAFDLTVDLLRRISVYQTSRIVELIDQHGLGEWIASSRDPNKRAGFVSIRSNAGATVVEALRKRGVWVDSRNNLIRIGPAPYTTDDELELGISAICNEIKNQMSAML